MYRKMIKRLVDVVLSFSLIIILFPLFLLLVIALSLYYRGNPFFTQKRPGLNEKVFRLIKFKSMIEKYDEQGNLLPDAVRLTAPGKLLRKTSVDEMPQLFNVLRGDMSFIGPRPLLVNYLPYYTERERMRHQVRPGITGLAQVSGRNYLKLPERLELDARYVENLTFLTDLKIVTKTIQKVLGGKDITIIASTKTLKDYRDEDLVR